MVAEEPRDIKTRLEDALEATGRVSDCRSIAVSRRDGLVIVHRLEKGLDSRLAAAMAAATLGAAASSARELKQGKVERVIVECEFGTIVATDAGPDAIVLAIYDRETNLGLALHGLAQTAQMVDRILEEL
jgi:predicted regulator of Ras-like GTPase activity (Roadblock/LC7/MglB family)